MAFEYHQHFFHGLQNLCPLSCDKHVCIKTDTSTAVTYINDMGGMVSRKPNSLAKQIQEWCIARSVHVTAQHNAGIYNVEANARSHTLCEQKEWVLKPDIFQIICTQLFFPHVDLFASRIAQQLDKYVAWGFDPGAVAVDALTLDKSGLLPYIFSFLC